MLIVIYLMVIGSLFVYISRFNFQLVSINLGFKSFSGVPLFYVIVASFLIGLVLSYVSSIIKSISTSFILHGKNAEIKKNKNEVLELTKRVQLLEIKNEKLSKGSGIKVGVRNNR